jgi:uncharacterized protein YdiU (UPF0061 family)
VSSLDFHFDHWYVEDLPGDPDERNVRRQVAGAAWTRTEPTSTALPQLIAHSPEVAEQLGIDPAAVSTEQFARVFSGNEVLDGMLPIAMNYGGHQFGNWAGQLGDGRAIALGEINTLQRHTPTADPTASTDANGGADTHHVLQLKGAGPTPYSRGADGRAVLRSSIREFLCSEAMHHLGVPTTRALSLTSTGDEVVRDMLYDGHPAPEPGAVVCRVAPSFVRFGHFELPASRGEIDVLRALVEHTIRRHYPHLLRADEATGKATDAPDTANTVSDDADRQITNETIVAWFAEVAERTADLMVDWMRVGFVHGVMNTDNLSILGLTIDYGPYGWLENFDPSWTPNTTDAGGRRYRYGNQPQIGQWNVSRLGSALHSLTQEVEPLQTVIDAYSERFAGGWDAALAAKLGVTDADPETRRGLADELLEILPLTETDMTIFFRTLGDLDPTTLDRSATDEEIVQHVIDAYYLPNELTGDVLTRTATWLRSYLDTSNSLISSSGEGPTSRRTAMHAVNPKYVLRNYLAQTAIDKAEVGEYGMIDELLDLLRAPYDDQPGRDEYAGLRPDWARERVGCSMLSCSS